MTSRIQCRQCRGQSLSHLPQLESIAISYIRTEDQDQSDWVNQFSTICPNLKSLWLHFGLQFTDDSLKEMVEGRIGWGKPLQNLTIISEGGCVIDFKEKDLVPKWSKWLRTAVPRFRMTVSYGLRSGPLLPPIARKDCYGFEAY